MGKIGWCKKKNHGIRLITPSNVVSEEYLKTAIETQHVMKILENQSNLWLSTAKYYCRYFAVYSLVMIIGIQCEIHDCTIEVAKFLEEQNILPKGYSEILEKDKKLRIENQYYLRNKETKANLSDVNEYVQNIQEISNSITEDQIALIRQKISSQI